MSAAAAGLRPIAGWIEPRGPDGPRATLTGGAASLEDTHARLAVAIDGEIANRGELRASLAPRGYRFAGEGSAEVLMRAYQHWDKDVVRHLRGAFAAAVWDQGKQRLLVARDRFGEKPLYVREAGGALAFASAPEAMFARPGAERGVDPEAVRACLRYRYVPGTATLYRGVRRVAPGCYLLWQFGRARESHYWRPPDREAWARKPLPADPVAEFIAALEEAVRTCLEGRRAPGVLLGAGFDSAALLAIASRHAQPVKTFTAGLAGSRELARAARLAKQFGAEHHEIVLTPPALSAALPEAIAARGAPLASASELALHALVRAAAGEVDVLLTGEGADEILGGYRRHALARLGLGRPHAGPAAVDGDPRASRLRRLLYAEQTAWLPELAERGARLGAAAALETRAPFLDHRLAEQVSALPDEQRVRGLATKWILRRALRRLAPQAAPRKGGFGIRAGDWLRDELRGALVDRLRAGDALARGYFEPAALERLLEEHLSRRRDHQELLWTLLNLEIWHRESRPA